MRTCSSNSNPRLDLLRRTTVDAQEGVLAVAGSIETNLAHEYTGRQPPSWTLLTNHCPSSAIDLQGDCNCIATHCGAISQYDMDWN